jgi:hypothetical protein
MTLSDLLKHDAPDRAAISEHLNGLSGSDQVREVRALSVKLVHRCWTVFEPGETIDLNHLVPADCDEGVAIHHMGVNTLPAFRHFEKRFARATGNPAEIWGYNHQTFAWLTGPGSFVVHEKGSDNEPALFIDYRSIPKGSIDGWPAPKSNDKGIAKLVYGGMQDYMRKVSDRVSVGRAFTNGKDRGESFMLVRAD